MVNHTGLDRQALATYLHKAEHGSAMAPVFILFVIGIALGTILLAIANWRTKLAPRWASIAIAVGGVSGVFDGDNTLSAATLAVLLSGLAALAWRVLAMSDEEWDAPLERPNRATARPPQPASAVAG